MVELIKDTGVGMWRECLDSIHESELESDNDCNECDGMGFICVPEDKKDGAEVEETMKVRDMRRMLADIPPHFDDHDLVFRLPTERDHFKTEFGFVHRVPGMGGLPKQKVVRFFGETIKKGAK